MYNLNDNVKRAFLTDGYDKQIIIDFPNNSSMPTILNDQIVADSLKITESIMSESKFEVVGCIASMMTVTVYNVKNLNKNKEIRVRCRLYINGTFHFIPLFRGILDSYKRQNNTKFIELTAYDALYRESDNDIADWYNNVLFPTDDTVRTLKEVRRMYFSYIKGISCEKIVGGLINDDIEIKKRFQPKKLLSLNFLKSLCQINCCFGLINKKGKFEFVKVLKNNVDGAIVNITQTPTYEDFNYPKSTLYPSETLYPGETVAVDYIGNYESVEFENYSINKINKVTIRKEDQDENQVSYGTATEKQNKYIIHGNIFAYDLEKEVLEKIAKRIFNCVKDFTYTPFSGTGNAYPWTELGHDRIRYEVIDFRTTNYLNPKKKKIDGFIFKATFSGCQHCVGEYSAEGEENQHEFVSDLGFTPELMENGINDKELQDKMSDYTYDKDTIDDKIIEGSEGWKVKSVDVLPENPDYYTLYLVKGTVVLH